MSIQVLHKNILESKDDAIVLTVDGVARGMEGNITRAFEQQYPEVWEEIEYDIPYPIPLGTVVMLDVHKDLLCAYKSVIIASTLHHIDVLSDIQKTRVISSALGHAVALSAQRGYRSIAATILAGGWRLNNLIAFTAMLNQYSRISAINPAAPMLKIYMLDSATFAEVEQHLITHVESLKAIDQGYHFEI